MEELFWQKLEYLSRKKLEYLFYLSILVVAIMRCINYDYLIRNYYVWIP